MLICRGLLNDTSIFSLSVFPLLFWVSTFLKKLGFVDGHGVLSRACCVGYYATRATTTTTATTTRNERTSQRMNELMPCMMNGWNKEEWERNQSVLLLFTYATIMQLVNGKYYATRGKNRLNGLWIVHLQGFLHVILNRAPAIRTL